MSIYVVGQSRFVEPLAREDANVPFVAVLNRFNSEKNRSTNHGDQHMFGDLFILAQLSSANGQCHRQTTEQENDRIQTTQPLVQKHVSLFENLRVMIAIQDVSNKQTAEKENFGYQKSPNTELARIELLFGGIEVMSDEFTMIMVVIVSIVVWIGNCCLLYTSPSPRDQRGSRMPSSA